LLTAGNLKYWKANVLKYIEGLATNYLKLKPKKWIDNHTYVRPPYRYD